ncbi:TetR/AcrR family transcriptional regulator [Blastococcus sp. SYSU D00820]
MATASSPAGTRIARRRAAVVEEALDHAEALIGEHGAAALSVSEVARRMGIRGPSLYKYFPSRAAVYDALFARGLAGQQQAVRAAVEDAAPGLPRLRAGGRAVVAWAVGHPALAQLLFWRPVPGFEPSPGTFAPSRAELAAVRAELAAAVRLGQLRASADSDDAVRLLTVVLAGLISQQLANQPGVPHAEGVFSRLVEPALDMFVAAHAP